MWLIRRLEKLSAAQKKLMTKNLEKNGVPNLIAYIYRRIVVIPLYVQRPAGVTAKRITATSPALTQIFKFDVFFAITTGRPF